MRAIYTLTLDLELNDVHRDFISYNLYRMTQHIMGNGMITGDSDVEIDNYNYDVRWEARP